MKMKKKVLLLVLILLNAVVLLGQLWPEGAPPFARTINIIFLVSSLLYFLLLIIKAKKG
jgi:hypothetical protein